MGVDVNLFARGRVSDERIAEAEAFMAERVAEAESPILTRTPWDAGVIRFNSLWRYYGPGYERGDWPSIYAAILALRAALPECEVFYGGDDDDEDRMEPVTDGVLAGVWAHWLSPNGFNYRKPSMPKHRPLIDHPHRIEDRMTSHLTGHGPATYRKKPAVVEAMQFVLGRTTKAQILDFCPGAGVGVVWPGDDADVRWALIPAPGGPVSIVDGDWIVRDDDGFRSVPPAIFAATYEAQDATTGRLTPGTGGSEGPPVSGPENAYKCEGDR